MTSDFIDSEKATRRYSALNYLSPINFERKHIEHEDRAQENGLPTAAVGSSQAPTTAVDNPAPVQLAFREEGVKVTLALSRKSVEFFKSEVGNILPRRLLAAYPEPVRVLAYRYCNPFGIEEVRARPTLLDDEYAGVPTYAVAFGGVEDALDYQAVVGYVALRLAVGPIAARQVYNRSHRGDQIGQELAQYITSRDAYFSRCGGSELLRIRYYFDDVERFAVMLDLEANEPPAALLKERRGTKLRFRDIQ